VGRAKTILNSQPCDKDRARADAVAAKHGVKVYYDVDSLLEDSDVKAICVLVSPVGRAALIHRIIKAGKDVLTTKPFEADPDAAIDVLAEARRLGRVVHANSPGPLLTEDLACVKQWHQEHNLGQAICAQWHTWCSYREEPDGSWLDSREQCPLGSMARLGIYGINDLLCFFPEPEWLQVMGSRIFTKRPTPDTAQVSIQFRNGAMATIMTSFCIQDGAPYSDSVIIGFENGVVYRNVGPEDSFPRRSVRLELQTCGGPGHEIITDKQHVEIYSCAGQYQWDVFYRAIQGETFDEVAYADRIVTSLRVINAIQRADSSGQREQVQI